MIQQRNTVQKRQVYAALLEHANHPTAEEVYQIVCMNHPNISRATVYRILNNMARDGKIYKVSVPDGADHFDHQTFPHYHIKCTECGKIFDVHMPVLDTLEQNAKAYDADLDIKGHVVLFYGTCPKCKTKHQ